MKLIITRHAQDQMEARGIDRFQVQMVIERGSKIPQTDGLVAQYTYIKVAYKMVGGKYIVKTVMIR